MPCILIARKDFYQRVRSWLFYYTFELYLRTKHKRIFWVAAAVTALTLCCWLFLFHGLFPRAGNEPLLNVSSTEAFSIFEHKATQFAAPPPFRLRQAISHPTS